MGHKITLTGIPLTSLEQTKNYFTFFMQEAGSLTAPRGLPASKKKIIYRIFVNKNQLNKAGLKEIDLTTKKLMIQGELVFGVLEPEYDLEVGVVCFQLQVLEVKEKPNIEEDHENKEQLDTTSTTSVNSNKKPKTIKLQATKGTNKFLEVDSIKIPEAFLGKTESEEKLEEIKQFIKRKKKLEFPLSINLRTGELMNKSEYIWFVAAKELLIEMVPVKLVDLPQTCLPEGTDKIMLLEDIQISERFAATKPRKAKMEQLQEYYEKHGRLDTPVYINHDNLLVDGYSRFTFLKQKREFKVPVKIVVTHNNKGNK